MFTIQTRDLQVPALGFGTWELRGEGAYDAVRTALDVGYRHIDTAQMYGNEDQVGRAIADSDVDRDEVFLTTKVWRDQAATADVISSTERSLDKLGVDRVDLLLLHWPADEIAPLSATMEGLNAVHDRGLTRAIGVSNFPAAKLAEACALGPVANDQVEHHPFLSVDAIRAEAADRDVFVTAYSPIAKGKVLEDDTIGSIAQQHDATPVQVTLRWHLQRGLVAIPRSSNAERIAANFDVFGFELSDDEVARINALANGGRLIDPPFGIEWDVA